MLATWLVLAACAWCARSGPGPPTLALPATTLRPEMQSYTFHFAHQLYNMSISENSGPRVYAVQPPDEDPLGIWLPPDIDPHSIRLRYRIRQGDKDKFFKAEDRVVGDFCFLFIRTRAGNSDVLNRERRDTYRLEIRATLTYTDDVKALTIGSLETDVVVVLSVTDVNDLGPLFYPTEYETIVSEDAAVHSSLTRVFAEDADLGSAGELYYSLDEPSDQFAVHPTTGVITLTRTLVHADNAEHHVNVIAQDRGSLLMRGLLPAVTLASHTARARLTVRVRPVNLHAPHIDVEKQPELVENTPSGEVYAIVRVSDSDEGVHGEITSLEIVDGDPDGHFRIKSAGRPGEFEVRVHALLDRERTPRGYNLTLRAIDAGIPPRTAYNTLAVRLADVNDNTPVFSREVYEASVSESAPPGTPLVRLKVTDADIGRNARVYIEIVGGNEEGEFHVNPDTGMLYTAVSLDAETRARYTLTVSAVDQGGTGLRRQSSAKVEVSVLDANDNDPVFERDDLLVDLDENRPSGALVVRLTARDIDSGENGYVSYSVANLRPVPFEVDHFTGAVRTTRLLDYETMRREYVLRVRASDWGAPYRRQAEMRLTIRLHDLNDNRPEFERVDCEGHLPRGLPTGLELFTLSAIDLDAGSVVSYRIVAGNDDGCYSLDSATGVLSLACDLSAVSIDMHVLNVTATDGTHFADTTSMVLHLVRAGSERRPAFECRDTGVARRLTDTLAAAEHANTPLAPTLDEFALTPSRYGENVHAPEFIDFPVEVKVNESTALGTKLVRLRARDRDLGYNGLLAYVISAGDPDSAFRIDPDTGDLTLIGYLDREREPDYYLNVTVYDLGQPPRAVSRLLPITVLDVNDNTPVFEKSLASFRVTENALNGTAVFHANATDRDEGNFALVQYSLSDNADLDFCVERDTGILRVCAPLDRERCSLYELVIRATDGGGLYAEALVRIVIDDVNDNAPAFGLSTWAARVREDVPVGTLVAVVEARDPDLGAGGRISYALADSTEDAVFAIDTASGVLRTIAPLDFEQRQVYGVAIRATDGGHPPLWSEAVVIVEVLDVDENLHAPQFVERVFIGTVQENSPPGTSVLVVNATDADPPGRDSRLAYYLLAGSGLGRFTIDDAGEVRTVAPLDRETVKHYWLTVCAQDHGLTPRHTCVQLYVEVADENDMVPWPEHAAYEVEVPEQCAGSTHVLRVRADDLDASTGPLVPLTYRIVAGNPDGLFTIDEATGDIRTTGRLLDREAAAEHALEVRVSDGRLACSARVVVRLTDVNDHAPSFLEPLAELRLPVDAQPHAASDDGSDGVDWDTDADADADETDDDGWHGADNVRGLLVAMVTALDADAGANGSVRYGLRARGAARELFRVDARSGRLVALRTPPAPLYRLHVRACDEGSPARCTGARVAVRVVAAGGGGTPQLEPLPGLHVAELDAPGLLLAVVRATDPDGDSLYYDIVDGDQRREFYLGRHTGNLLLAKRLLHERQSAYALNVSVTDGRHTAYGSVAVTVINDVNEAGVRFPRDHYEVAVEESARAGAALATLRAAGAGRLLYGLHAARAPASLALFRLDSLTGVLELAAPLDRETATSHELTVWVRDGAPRASRAFARVLVRVHDADEHAPDWGPRRLVVARLPHRAPPGTLVAKLRATDLDAGENARILYSLVDGSAGGLFAVHPMLGDVTLTATLPAAPHDYTLQVRAANPPPSVRASTLPLHVLLVEPDDAPPRFLRTHWVAEIYENEPPGALLLTLDARSPSTVWFELESGADGAAFRLNPSAGALTTVRPLDYEQRNLYNLSVRATNMGGGWSRARVVVHVLDRNEFPPLLERAEYAGRVSEAAAPGTLVTRVESAAPLVLSTVDADSPANRRRAFEIVERNAAEIFTVDPVTGALAVAAALDHETTPRYRFTVKVVDKGSPRLYSDSAATVTVLVEDVNDCSPRFEHASLNATLLLPTAVGVVVTQVRATDLDTPDAGLHYRILEGNESAAFVVDGAGSVSVGDPTRLTAPGHLRLHVRVSDGPHATTTRLDIYLKEMPNSGLVFEKPDYFGSVLENSTKTVTVAVMNVLGTALDEHITFHILNPTEMFTMGRTSGAVRTTGRRFDRELRDSYSLLVEARTEPEPAAGADEARVARSRLYVSVTDVNDNCPVFVERPYVAGVAGGADAGAEVLQVRALDADAGDNGQVRYEMKRGHGELFRVERHSGRITLKQPLEARNQLYRLVVAAFDGGSPACGAEAEVEVRVWGGGAAPWWERARLELVAREDMTPGSALTPALTARSPLSRPLVYTLLPTEPPDAAALTALRLFELDFDTGALRVAGTLDYEAAHEYSLMVRATDTVTGAHADASLVVHLEDANDCTPQFEREEYRSRLSEALAPGALALRLRATDNDTGVNAELTYWLAAEEGASVGAEHFIVDGVTGEVRVARALDRERHAVHHLSVGVRDAGSPPRSSIVHVWLELEDVNDSAPRVQRPLVTAHVWEAALRGHAVARVAAYDPDESDARRLQYALADPDEARARAFHIDPSDGVITVGDGRAFGALTSSGRDGGAGGGVRRAISLNVSVSDGAHAAFARVKITLTPDNTAPPQFTHLLYEARVPENRPPPLLLTTVKAHDPDWGEYGAITYSIPSTLLRETFAVDATTGAMTTRVPLDRERRAEWSVPVTATDGGGLLRHTSVRVRVADLNDNAPVFFHREYRASVPSDSRHPFITVLATDADDGANADVVYSIYEPEPKAASAARTVRGLLTVDPRSGAVSLARNASQYESQLVSSWVRATDGGGLYATAPLAVYVLGPGERAPPLRLAHADFFLPESAAPGTLITELGELDDGIVLRLAEGLWPRDLFAVDALGRLTLAGALDRETQSVHHIGVLAIVAAGTETEAAPASMAQVVLHVLDENEHAPVFHSQPYVVFIAENTPPHSSILQVVAEDADAGSNGEVSYAFAEGAGPFSLDAHSGWLTLTEALDRERTPEYRLAVVATDGAAVAQRRAARTTVVVRLRDYDDCEPVFAQEHYVVDVPEDAIPGTVVARLELRDGDYSENPVDMYVTHGDLECQFGVRASGEVFVARPLDRERTAFYELRVLASDGKFSASTSLALTVTDVNDNPPHCVRQRYRVALAEDAPVGAHVAVVEVRDADEPQHARPRFYLTGDGADRFSVDKESGRVLVAAPLDRETRPAYTLLVHAQDREQADWECSSELEITLNDVNDNAPRFTAVQYGVTLPEDAEPGTLVAKIHAVDADAGLNRFVRYELDETSTDAVDAAIFRVASDGIVTLAAPLDRETRAAHRALIVARDGGEPQRTASAVLVLTVADVNDNPPRFEFAQYFARVPELDEVGTEILRVTAISADSGVNADVYYAIAGGDERHTFAIDRKTGAISIARPLDYETTREYMLTVQAVDGGEPPLNDLASVNITVLDCNDNPPVFAQKVYEVRVREDAPSGHRVVQTIADDVDTGPSGRVVYGIERGNEEGHFIIDPDTGYVSVAAPLDRESRDLYELTVRADDRGVPALHSTAALRVRVADVNDNPPLFTQENYTAVVREDSQLGYTVLRLAVTDADAPPNGPPFTFDFQAGNEMGAFRLEQDGRLETAARFNRRAKERHVLRVRVFDNGTPPLYSDAHVEVRVVERSQYPPVVTPLDVLVNSYRDEFPGGIIGRVHASDRDAYDTLDYSLTTSAAIAALFTIDAADGTLRAQPRLDAGEYRLNVTVTDGKFDAYAVVRVTVIVISDEVLNEAVVVRFRAVTDADFVLAHRKGFVRAVCNAMSARIADVLLLAVQTSSDDESETTSRVRRQVARDLDVVFAVRAPGGSLHAAETVRKRLNANLAELEQITRLVVEELVRGTCGGCVHGACAERVQLLDDRVHAVATEMFSLVSAPARLRAACACLPGYTGARCEVATPALAADEEEEVAYLPGDAYLLYRVDAGVVNGRRLLADELFLSMRFRTRRSYGTLAFAAGSIDYNILEIEEGFVQFRQWLGSGEGTVRVNAPVADGGWHHLRLERRGASVRLAVDRHAATGRAPPPAAVLDLRDEFLTIGARLERHAHALAPDQPAHAFVGCLADLHLAGESLPLAESVSAPAQPQVQLPRVQLMRKVRVHTAPSCPQLSEPTVCASYPCLHGGTCHERLAPGADGEIFDCECHARFAGRQCEHDSEPCASQPCLHGGKCLHLNPPGFVCVCAAGLRGARCELGRWCGSPVAVGGAGVCAHGGLCEEGEWGPSCRCHGYYGPLCQHDVDECVGEPCLNGATCINEPGSFRCLCPPDRTGMNCGNPLYSDAVVAVDAAGFWDGAVHWVRAATWPFWVGVTTALLALLSLTVLLIVICHRRRHPPPAAPAHKESLLNSDAPAPAPDVKRASKLSNLEAQRERRVAAAASRSSPYRTPLNNMDTLRSYGSAGDELELMPPDYLRNLNMPAAAADKPWSEQMHLRTFSDNKIYNDLKGANASKRGTLPGLLDNRLRTCGRAPSPPAPDPHLLGGYHWDVSDWGAAALGAAISEVAGSERPDSSEAPSDTRADRSDTTNTRGSVRTRGADSSGEDERYGRVAAYALHPDAYLPRATADTDSDGAASSARLPARNRLRRADAASLITMLEERSSLLGDSDEGAEGAGDAASCSSASANVCDIEESDAEEPVRAQGAPLTTDV